MLVLFRMCHLAPAIAKTEILQKLFRHLLKRNNDTPPEDIEAVKGEVVTEEQLLSDVQLLAILVTSHPLSAPVVNCLFEARVASAVFSLGVFIFASHPLCDMKQLVVSVCANIVCHCEARRVAQCLEEAIVGGGGLDYAVGPSGGVVIRRPPHHQEEPVGGHLISLLGGMASGGRIEGVLDCGDGEGEGEAYLEVMRCLALSRDLSNAVDGGEGAVGGEDTTASMGGVVQRGKGVCGLLVTLHGQRTGQGPYTDGGSGAAVGAGTKSEEVDHECEEDCHVPSALFIKMVRSYLGVSCPATSESSQYGSACTCDGSFSREKVDLAPHICGMILLVMKSHIPVDVLLQDGK